MDTVSHLLGMARLEAGLDKRCLLGRTTRMDVPAYPARHAPFHLLLDGACRLSTGGHVLRMSAGDMVIIPGGTAHRIVTAGGGEPHGIVDHGGRALGTVRSEGGGEAVADVLCGHFRFGAGAGALLFRSLPDPLHVRLGGSAASARTVRTLSAEMRREATHDAPGTLAVLSALCTVLLVMALRTSGGAVAGAPPWTAAGDPRVARVVERVLDAPGEDWTVRRMAAEAAMSRASFLRHFRHDTGMTAGALVTYVRLMTASHLLLDSDDTVVTVAARVGYRSESAFIRAFRGAVGSTPARFRRAADQR